MQLINEETIANAKERAYERKCTELRHLGNMEFRLRCASNHYHIQKFERRSDGTLWGECVLEETGELCPAHIGKRLCYHIASALALFLYLEARDRDLDGETEIAVMSDAPLPEPTRPSTWRSEIVTRYDNRKFFRGVQI